jgi:tripartite-type tricarboxylate transporter receptor subunit TctC
MIMPFAPGGAGDFIGRILSVKMSEILGQQVFIENKPGLGGNVGLSLAAKSQPDGYTIVYANIGAVAINPALYPNLNINPLKDFVPIILGPKTPNIFTANPGVSIKTLPELVEMAKKSPLNYASSGIGTTTHLSMERLKTIAKIDIVHAPYQPATAITAVVAGHTQIATTSMPPAVPMIKAGKLIPLAVTSSKRSPLLPDVPSITEFGYKDFDDYTWFGFFFPAGTPQVIVDKFNTALNQAMETPEITERFAQLGMSSSNNSAADFRKFLQAEVPKWAAVVKSSGAKAE